MIWRRIVAVLGLFLIILGASRFVAFARDPSPSGYHLIKTIPLPGEGGWDYVAVDSDARRIYVSHSSRVVVVDADSFAIVGEIPDTPGIHGIALAPELGRGFTSNGRSNTVTIFDLKSLKAIATTSTGKNPDAIVYEPASKRVFTLNGGSNDATAINAADGSVVATLALAGRPEFAVADGRGLIYVNIESTSELLKIDAQALKILKRWPLKPCEDPSGLALDRKNRRLFVACGNSMLAVVDAASGKLVATPASGGGTDAAAFDPRTGLAFASNGEGTLTVIKQDSPDQYSVLENVPTRKSARTMGLDLKTHNLYLPAADMIPPKQGERWPSPQPGTFVLLVIGK